MISPTTQMQKKLATQKPMKPYYCSYCTAESLFDGCSRQATAKCRDLKLSSLEITAVQHEKFTYSAYYLKEFTTSLMVVQKWRRGKCCVQCTELLERRVE